MEYVCKMIKEYYIIKLVSQSYTHQTKPGTKHICQTNANRR